MSAPAGPVPTAARAPGDAAEEAAPRILNRDRSWLDFNQRVLALAGDATVPLLERVRFLAIAANNLDDFVQIRGAVLAQNSVADSGQRSADGFTTAQQRDVFRQGLHAYARAQDALFATVLQPALAAAGIRLLDFHELPRAAHRELSRLFTEQLFAVLTPLAVDPAHPFPYISSLSLNLAVVLADPVTHEQHIARIKVPPALPRFAVLDGGSTLVPLEQVICAHLDALFPGMDIVTHAPFRLTRGADFQLDTDEDDLLEAVRDVLRRRRLSPLVVRLEVDERMPAEVLDLLVEELAIDASTVERTETLLDLAGLSQVAALDLPALQYARWRPTVSAALRTPEGVVDVFAAMREHPILVHHPYEDFDASTAAFIQQAAADPAVLAIKQTLYRTSGQDSSVIRALTSAAEHGKEVVALVELTARFDELANIAWAETLEQSGVHVVYGIVGLKTHAKVALVVRSEEGRIRRYCHLGTGNYNPDTARIYEDISLFTCDPEICLDVSELFNSLSGYSRQVQYRRLLLAPHAMRTTLLELIGQEARRGGRIVLKGNSLIDPEVVEALYAAAESGAEIDCIIRGMCALNPAACTEPQRLRVRSIVGRYLEHSRIWRFGRGGAATHFITSADLMPRNLDRRVEVAVPITDPPSERRLDEVLDCALDDTASAWTLDGSEWIPPRAPGTGLQAALHQAAESRNR